MVWLGFKPGAAGWQAQTKPRSYGPVYPVVTQLNNLDGTDLSYEAKAQIGGKLAQVGSRLIDSVAKKMADDFFKAFQIAVGPKPTEQISTTAEAHKVAPTSDLRSADTRLLSSPQSPEKMVPAWWIFPAFVLGAAIMLAGSRWMN